VFLFGIDRIEVGHDVERSVPFVLSQGDLGGREVEILNC
jgi:hypothetical protein